MSRPFVLMVDNNLGDQQLLALAFAEARIEVQLRTVDDGIEGKKALQRMMELAEPQCCLVLLDLNMPRLDGRELLAWARGTAAFATMPIIVLTSSHMARDREQCLSAGATAFRVKPSDFNEYVKFATSLIPYLT